MSSLSVTALPADCTVHEQALRELAHLALVAQSGGARTSAAALDALLDYLRRLTGAQRATLLLRVGPFDEGGVTRSAATYVGRSRPLAANGAEAGSEPAASGMLGRAISGGAGSDCWLTHPLPLTAESGDAPADSQHAHALLMLGWGASPDGCVRAAEAKQLLDCVAEAAGATVAAAVLAERAAAFDPQTRDEATAPPAGDRVAGDLLGTVGHELRSPLAAIKGYAATLRRHEHRLSREERGEFLLAIEAASDRLSLIVDRLLEVSQLESGNVSLHRMPVDLGQLAASALAAAEARPGDAGKPRHRLTLRLGDDAGHAGADGPILATGDPRYLRHMVDALLENAIKYSPEGG